MLPVFQNQSDSATNWFYKTRLWRYYTRLYIRSFLSTVYVVLLTLTTLYTFAKGIDEFFCMEKRYEVTRNFVVWEGISSFYILGEKDQSFDAFEINNDTYDCGMNIRFAGRINHTIGDDLGEDLRVGPSYWLNVLPVLYSYVKWNATFFPENGTIHFTSKTNEIGGCAVQSTLLNYDEKCEMKEKTRNGLYACCGIILCLFLILFLTTPLDLNKYYMLRRFKDFADLLNVGKSMVLGNPVTGTYTVHTLSEKYCVLSNLDNLEVYQSDFYSNNTMHIQCYVDGSPRPAEGTRAESQGSRASQSHLEKTSAESREFHSSQNSPGKTSAESREFHSRQNSPEKTSAESREFHSRQNSPEKISAEFREFHSSQNNPAKISAETREFHSSRHRLEDPSADRSQARPYSRVKTRSSKRNSQPYTSLAVDNEAIPMQSFRRPHDSGASYAESMESHHLCRRNLDGTLSSEGSSPPYKVLLVASNEMSLHSLGRPQWENFRKYISLIKHDPGRCCTKDVGRSTWSHWKFSELLSRMEGDSNLLIKEEIAAKTFYSLF